MTPAKHVAIIMDGNGRWAQTRNRDRTYGHIKGALVAKKIITEARKQNISFLTLFAFSTENWLRPPEEVHFLMRLLRHQVLREQKNLMDNNIQFQTIGNLDRLPKGVTDAVAQTVDMTKNNTGMVLTFGLNYGGRQEIVAACRKIANMVEMGRLSPEQVNEAIFSQALPSALLPDPDLIIRTSGEQRISNFMLWQTAYTELYFTNILWPDFKPEDFRAALEHYSLRSRRFGGIKKTQREILA